MNLADDCFALSVLHDPVFIDHIYVFRMETKTKILRQLGGDYNFSLPSET